MRAATSGKTPETMGERHGGTGTMPKFPNLSGTTEREPALGQSHREDGVFDVLIEVLEETPEALSLEYSDRPALRSDARH